MCFLRFDAPWVNWPRPSSMCASCTPSNCWRSLEAAFGVVISAPQLPYQRTTFRATPSWSTIPAGEVPFDEQESLMAGNLSSVNLVELVQILIDQQQQYS